MAIRAGRFEVRLAENDEEIAAAQRLRYRVFVEERGASATPEEAAIRRESDEFDKYFQHLILIDHECESPDPLDRVVGLYRLMTGERAKAGMGFYGQHEYDLTKFEQTDRKVVELGRSCVAEEYRGGAGMHLLWSGLGEFVTKNEIEILFGVASFHGSDVKPLEHALSFLHQNYQAPEELRLKTLPQHYVDMDIIPADQIDRKVATKMIPPLIKAYLRQGCFIGDGAFIDYDFNTVDVAVVMDTTRMKDRYREFYTRMSAETEKDADKS